MICSVCKCKITNEKEAFMLEGEQFHAATEHCVDELKNKIKILERQLDDSRTHERSN